jgi:hypothetical protein
MAKPQWLQDKERDDLAERKAKYEATRDLDLEECVIAYCNWRTDGNQGSFDLFKRDWYARRGKVI